MDEESKKLWEDLKQHLKEDSHDKELDKDIEHFIGIFSDMLKLYVTAKSKDEETENHYFANFMIAVSSWISLVLSHPDFPPESFNAVKTNMEKIYKLAREGKGDWDA